MHYLILVRFTVAEFFTAKMTYWMVLYHTKKTNRKSNCKKQWLVFVKQRDLTITGYKYFQTTWIVACFIANIVIIFEKYDGQLFPNPDN